MAYQAAPRFHVSDMHSLDDEDLLQEDHVVASFPNWTARRWIGAIAALLLVFGTLLGATYALYHHSNTFRNKGFGGMNPETVNLDAQQISSCMACVTQGRSWQMGTCNPTKTCLMMDQACYEDVNGCNQWQEEAEAELVCKTHADCTSCISNNQGCLWNDDVGCFMLLHYDGPEHFLVVKHGEICSAERKTAETLTTVKPHPVSGAGGFLKPSWEPLAECVACVETGKSWQAGKCNPSLECIDDIGCFRDASGCRQWDEEQKAVSTCKAQKDCSSCLASNDLCMWQPHSGCFTGSNYWGLPEGVLKKGEECPEDEAAPLASAGLLKERVLMDRKRSEELTSQPAAGS